MILTRPNSAIADMVEATYRKRRSFAAGFTLTNAKEVLLYDTDGNYYQWKGALPKVVPANSTPANSGGVSATAWVSVGKADDIAIINAKFTNVQNQIDVLRNSIPDAGKSAYDIAVENGFVGTEQQWLASLKGDPGAPLNLKGSLAGTGQLPTTGNKPGDAYIVGQVLYAWDGSAWKLVSSQGPAGDSAYEVWLAAGNTGTIYDYLDYIKGAKGDPGPQGAKGNPGNNANGFDYQGALSAESQLPPASFANVSDAYSIGSDLYVSNGDQWINMGSIVGPKGDKGDKGNPGDDGVDGQDGDSAYQIWLNAGNFGTVDDFLASLKGEKGDKGDKGEQGEQGAQGVPGIQGEGLNIVGEVDDPSELPPPEEVAFGTAYLVGKNKELYIWVVVDPDLGTGEWLNAGVLSGTSITAHGSVPTAADLPNAPEYGAAYLTADTGNLYIYTLNSDNTEGYVDMGSIKGPKGDKGDKGNTGATGTNGTNGATWLSGTTVPAAGTGNNGDFYLNTTTSDVYKKTSGAWAVVVNIKGPKGDTGTAGTNGTNGATWLTGTGAPASTLGVNGDLYLNTTTSDVYQKTSGTWTVIANIKGAPGDVTNVADTPYPDVWAPFSDDLRLLAGIAPYDKITISGQVLELASKSVTFSRSTTATYIDKSGLMVTAEINEPRFEKQGLLMESSSTNLYTYSETIGAGSGVTATNNAGTSPTGENTMSLITENAAGGEHYAGDRNIPLTAGTSYCFSAYVKASQGDRWLYLRTASGTTSGTFFDVTNGKWGSDNFSAPVTDRGFESLGNGIYRVWMTFTATNTQSTVIRLQLSQRNQVATYTGDGASGLYLWGAQLEESTFPSSYIKTVASTVTRSPDLWTIVNTNTGYQTLADKFKRTVAFEFVPKYTITTGYADVVRVPGVTNDIICRLTTANRIQSYRDGGGTPAITVTPGVLGIVTHVTSGDDCTMYYDGTPSYRAQPPSNTTTKPTNISNSVGSANGKFAYYIRNFRIWHRELTVNQIKGLR